MRAISLFAHGRLAAGCLLGMISLAVAAAPPPGGPHGEGACGPEFRGPPGPPGAFGGFGPPHFGPDFHEGPPYLRDLALSEEQQDKVFAIVHAAAPQLREQEKTARKNRDALRDLGLSPDYDAAKAASLAQIQAAAESKLTLLHARMDHDIYGLLTADQRQRLVEQRDRPFR